MPTSKTGVPHEFSGIQSQYSEDKMELFCSCFPNRNGHLRPCEASTLIRRNHSGDGSLFNPAAHVSEKESRRLAASHFQFGGVPCIFSKPVILLCFNTNPIANPNFASNVPFSGDNM